MLLAHCIDQKERPNKQMFPMDRGKDYIERGPAPLFESGEFKSWSLWRAGIAEFMAAFLFLYITILAIMGMKRSNDVCSTVGIQGIAWAFRGMIFALVYCRAGILGGHINPAVTFGLFLDTKLSLARAVFYMICQCLSAICGAGVVKRFEGHHNYKMLGGGANSVAHGYTKGDGLGVEIVATFVLVYTVFSAIDAKMGAPIKIGQVFQTLESGDHSKLNIFFLSFNFYSLFS